MDEIGYDEQHADYEQDDTFGTRHSKFKQLEAIEIDVVTDNIRTVVGPTLCKQVDHVKRPQGAHELQHGQCHQRRQYAGNGD